MRRLIFYVLLVLAVSLQAQIGGNATYKFLNLSISAKQAALGGKVYTSLKGDIFQPSFNPATLDSTLNYTVGINYTNYLGDINYGNMAFAKKIKYLGTIYMAAAYVNYGKFEYADINGDRNGLFGASETALIIGYAYQIPNSYWHLGINSKFILSVLDNYTSTGLAFDFGINYNNNLKGLNMGFVIRNAGWQLSTYQTTREKLPFEIDFTLSKTLLHAPFKWFMTLDNLQKPTIAFVNSAHNTQDPNGNIIQEDIKFSDQLFRHVIFGVELFPRKRFNLRAGYNFRRGAELSQKDERLGSGLNFGFGLRLRKFEINYAYSNYNYAANASFFSLTINLNEL